MIRRHLSNCKSSNQKVLDLFRFVKENETSDVLELESYVPLHEKLIRFSTDDWNALISDFHHWNDTEQNMVSDCIAYGIDKKLGTPYTNEQRMLGQQVYSKVKTGFTHPDIKKWRKDFRAHSKTKSTNLRVLHLYDYLLKNEFQDSDFWYMGGGDHEIQKRINHFDKEDWIDLKKDVVNWSEIHVHCMTSCIPFEPGQRSRSLLTDKQLQYAGKFLLDLFMANIGDRIEIAESAYFVAESKLNSIENLKSFLHWLKHYGFDNPENPHNPIKIIELAIEKKNS
mgnify:CR=1 FL=1